MTTIWALTSSGGFCAGCIPIRTVPLRSGMRTGCSRNRRSSTWGTAAITNWLVEQRILQKVTTPDGKQRRVPFSAFDGDFWKEIGKKWPLWCSTPQGFLLYTMEGRLPSLCEGLIHGRWLPDPAVISIHPPRVGWDHSGHRPALNQHISIHPPRVGWDKAVGCCTCAEYISIHPPRVGWDVSLNRRIP